MKQTTKWASTMQGFSIDPGIVLAHQGQSRRICVEATRTRQQREEQEQLFLSKGATISDGAGCREVPEEPDPMRTAFERDRDRILHSSSFRRLAGKTQVFIFPSDHQRTRLTHALEVSQVALAISQGVGLNSALTEAIALGHDCGHGPGGHASEDAFSTFLENGYDHATWGADHTLKHLNLCIETLDGIRNHSWSRPEPLTPEGLVVSFADRIAYCLHDLEDAIRAHIVCENEIPPTVAQYAGVTRGNQLRYFILDMVTTISNTGEIALSSQAGLVLAELRRFNYEKIYMRTESVEQSDAVVKVLTQLVDFYIAHPAESSTEIASTPRPYSKEAVLSAVTYVSGMTDRFAFNKAIDSIGYDPTKLPRGIDFSPSR